MKLWTHLMSVFMRFWRRPRTKSFVIYFVNKSFFIVAQSKENLRICLKTITNKFYESESQIFISVIYCHRTFFLSFVFYNLITKSMSKWIYSGPTLLNKNISTFFLAFANKYEHFEGMIKSSQNDISNRGRDT